MELYPPHALQRLLTRTEWAPRARVFAETLRATRHRPGGLLLVGTPTYEPWHLAAHLGDAAQRADLPHLQPTLIRHTTPPNAPPHLNIGLPRLTHADRGDTVLVIAPHSPSIGLLDRLNDARHAGATILAIHTADSDLASLTHDELTLATAPNHVTNLGRPELRNPTSALPNPFDVAQHLISTAIGVTCEPKRSRRRRRLSHQAPDGST